MELSSEDIEFIRQLSDPDLVLQFKTDDSMSYKLYSRIRLILQEYYRENTQISDTQWTEKFEEAGITKDNGKYAIACARRLGMNIT